MLKMKPSTVNCQLDNHCGYTLILVSSPIHIDKDMDTIGKCQRPVFPLGVSQHYASKNKFVKFELNWLSTVRNNYESKNSLVTRSETGD
jgi:hypothetical protein